MVASLHTRHRLTKSSPVLPLQSGANRAISEPVLNCHVQWSFLLRATHRKASSPQKKALPIQSGLIMSSRFPSHVVRSGPIIPGLISTHPLLVSASLGMRSLFAPGIALMKRHPQRKAQLIELHLRLARLILSVPIQPHLFSFQSRQFKACHGESKELTAPPLTH